MPKHVTTTTQFIDGDANGIRICHKMLSTMQAVYIPRPLLDRAKKIPGLPLRGIYYLISDEDGEISQLYVGQTTKGINRLIDHNANKGFWNKAILFLSDDTESFSLDNLSALEKFAYEKAQNSNRYSVENINDIHYEISEYQAPVIEQVYEEIAFLMGAFGYELEDAEDILSSSEVLHTTRRGIRTRGIYTGATFDLLEGSEIDVKTPSHNKRYEEMRSELIRNGYITIDENGMGVLMKTISFKSPSGAADFALGGSNNGWIEWKNAEKITLDALYR